MFLFIYLFFYQKMLILDFFFETGKGAVIRHNSFIVQLCIGFCVTDERAQQTRCSVLLQLRQTMVITQKQNELLKGQN